VTDFQCLWGITDAMTKPFGWTDGVNKLYTILAQDFVYKNPMRNVVFLDNHDMARFYSTVGENVDKYCTAICWMLTTRGIPQMYYSSEFATTGTTSPNDGYVRLDFPGGWPGDVINKFVEDGRNEKDKRIFHTIQKLANYRKKSSALKTGKFKQFLPNDGLYVFFRYDSKQMLMIAMNTSDKEQKLNIENYRECIQQRNKGTDVMTDKQEELNDFFLKPWETKILELKP
jgi:glycosidase